MPYETPQDAEDAFYDAFEEGDLDRMMAAWSPASDIVCIQPLRDPAVGPDAVRASWNEVFATGNRVEIEILHRHWIEQNDMAVHIVKERLTIDGNVARRPPPLVATNVYRREEDGWRLILHHVSPPPPPPGMGPPMAGPGAIRPPRP